MGMAFPTNLPNKYKAFPSDCVPFNGMGAQNVPAEDISKRIVCLKHTLVRASGLRALSRN